LSEIRFLLDENLPPTYRLALLRREPSMVVWHVGLPGAPRKGTPDEEILVWCEENQFVLVTNNRRSMPNHLQTHLQDGRHIPGILTITPQMSLAEVIEDLLLVWSFATASEFSDLIIYLPI
jgi:hypothetical protein